VVVLSEAGQIISFDSDVELSCEPWLFNVTIGMSANTDIGWEIFT